MRSVDVKFHIVAAAAVDWHFPADDLRLLYRTAGIDLNFVEGDRIDDDPTNYPIGDYPTLVDRYRKTDNGFGHFIIGIEPPRFNPQVAGQLLDVENRGVSVAYTNSNYVQQFGDVGLLQTCAHEIGHMLNLAHEDVVTEFVSTMDQALKRTSAITQSWNGAAFEAEQIRRRGDETYFFPQSKALRCYPLAYSARLRLNTSSGDQLLPWRGKFERPYDGTNDSVQNTMRVTP